MSSLDPTARWQGTVMELSRRTVAHGAPMTAKARDVATEPGPSIWPAIRKNDPNDAVIAVSSRTCAMVPTFALKES
jgi:hypothetical protein